LAVYCLSKKFKPMLRELLFAVGHTVNRCRGPGRQLLNFVTNVIYARCWEILLLDKNDNNQSIHSPAILHSSQCFFVRSCPEAIFYGGRGRNENTLFRIRRWRSG